MEELLENYALVQLMKEDDSERLEVREAKELLNDIPEFVKYIYEDI